VEVSKTEPLCNSETACPYFIRHTSLVASSRLPCRIKLATYIRHYHRHRLVSTNIRQLRVCMSIYIYIYIYKRLRWSRGSELAFGAQVRGFKPGRSRRIFKAVKILSTPSFGGEVKPSVPCRRSAACKRSLELRGSRILDEICRNISRPRRVPPSAARGLSRRWT